MGKGRTGLGVVLRDDSIQLKFRWNGKRYSERLDWKPTPANERAARKLAERLRSAIEEDKRYPGTFKYADFFPGSKHARESANIRNFAEYCDLWLQAKGRLADATKSQYRNALNFWKTKFSGPITRIPNSQVAAVVGGHAWPSAKLCNNYLIPLRGVMQFAIRDLKKQHGIVVEDPMEGIENSKHQKDPPDPFTREELEAILDDMRAHYPAQVWRYFEFMFYSGCRPEEAIALKWTDIDWTLDTARVERARTFRGTLKPLKTYSVRDLELNDKALAALKGMRAFTQAKGEFVFENPVTGKPWHDNRSQLDNYWKPTIRRTKLRYRPAYNTRHTFATVLLMAEVNPVWIAQQLGHKDAKLLFSTYSKWINRADKKKQVNRANSAFQSQIGPTETASG